MSASPEAALFYRVHVSDYVGDIEDIDNDDICAQRFGYEYEDLIAYIPGTLTLTGWEPATPVVHPVESFRLLAFMRALDDLGIVLTPQWHLVGSCS